MLLRITALALVAAVATPCCSEDAPNVDDVLKKVDAAVFFHDAQEGLKGYRVQLKVWSGGGIGGKAAAPEEKDLKPAGTLTLDATTGTKTQTGPDDQPAPPSTFTPSCGPWTLTALAAFEAELFTMPFSKRFSEQDWERDCTTTDDGFCLTLTAKEPIGEPFMLKPALTGLEIDVDKDGIPTGATLHLDQKMMHDDGKVKFVFVEEGGKKRIDRIENELRSANLCVRPALVFMFGKVSGWTLPESVEFCVAGADLSPSLGGMEMATTLFYRDYEVTK